MVRIEVIASSRARLTIASLLSTRPRTLGELAEVTGMSVQGVLKHLKKLEEARLLRERKMKRGRYLKQRKLYFIDNPKVADYSQRDVLVATMGRPRAIGEPGEKTADRSGESSLRELDGLAQDVLILRRRVRDLARRTARMVDEVVESESRIATLVSSLGLTDEEEQVARLVYGDDSPETVRQILREQYGCTDPEGAIRDVMKRIRSASR